MAYAVLWRVNGEPQPQRIPSWNFVERWAGTSLGWRKFREGFLEEVKLGLNLDVWVTVHSVGADSGSGNSICKVMR